MLDYIMDKEKGYPIVRKIKSIILSAIIGMSVLSLAACGGSEQPTEGAKGQESAKSWVVGTNAEYPPFEYQQGGEIVGFDIDIIKAIGEVSGIEVKVEHMGWDPMFDAIDKGKADVAVGAITIREDRKQLYDFSEPYFDAKQLILVPQDSSVTTLENLQGKKIGVQSATTGEKAVQDKFGLTYEGLKGYEDTPSAVDDLINGRLDAVVADNAVVLEYAKKIGDKGFKIIDDPAFAAEHYGIMVKKGNAETLKLINDGYAKIKENGKFDEIYEKYFGKR